ncbi:MAG: bifunctional oligoribonuclease/PAP phosphatase NrnA [Lachnospiraceae bacterium]|nr:bifunctional oligoribonuclease/PAP phosphatase NrnA [Lachnospiraceae bacterium]
MNLLQECSGAKVIGISGHTRPDGDCVGSCMALYMYLKKILPEADITVYLEESAKAYHHMLGVEDIDFGFTAKEHYDVFFCLDTTPDRLGDAQPLYDCADKKINIDHHITNPGSSDVNYIQPEIGSCAELIYNIIPEEALDNDMAKAIYIGIIHDTGVFQFSNTKPSTLNIAAKLIQYDIDFANLIQESFYEKSYKQTKIMADVVQRSRMYLEGRCLAGVMTLEDMTRLQAHANDFNGIINRLKSVRGVDCAVFLYEIESGLFKVSLRTSDRVDATVIACAFGGGGHVRAAGCTVKGSPEEVMELLTKEISNQL